MIIITADDDLVRKIEPRVVCSSERWYYFNPVSDDTRGALFVNRTTPDGSTVGADGI